MLRQCRFCKYARYKKKSRKKNFFPTYLVNFFWPCYQKQTIIFSWPDQADDCHTHETLLSLGSPAKVKKYTCMAFNDLCSLIPRVEPNYDYMFVTYRF